MLKSLLAAALLVSMSANAADPPLWVSHGQLTPQARELLGVLRRVEDFGLDREEFMSLVLDVEAEAASRPSDPARLDADVNVAVLRLVQDLHDGRVDPGLAGYHLSRRRSPLDAASTLRHLATSASPLTTLSAIEPRAPQYRALKQTLARYRGIREPALTAPPGKALIRPGDAYTDAAGLRRLLAAFGDLAEADAQLVAAPAIFDPALADAVARFQRRHGLQADGILGPRTFAVLSIPVAQRVRQLELTLERWRWLPEIHAPAVIVNVPQFVLYTLPDPADSDPEAQTLEIPVIVGQEERQTPVFDSRIEAVVIRPYWEVPRSITEEELLPLIEKDARYLERHDLEIVRGGADNAQVLPADAAGIAKLRAGRARLRQRPGAGNALGLIKFVLPNLHDVYLHSTPEAQLFARERRALSHGCVRVRDSVALAAYLLKNTPGDWSYGAIDAATCLDETIKVRLATPVPVYILYCTAVIDRRGDVLFFDDVYGYDRKLEGLLAERDGTQGIAARSSSPRVPGGAQATRSMVGR